MRKYTFNTGRYYSPELQPIELVIVDDTLFFNDRARLITGKVEKFSGFIPELAPSDKDIETAFLSAYDSGSYTEVSLHTFLTQGE